METARIRFTSRRQVSTASDVGTPADGNPAALRPASGRRGRQIIRNFLLANLLLLAVPGILAANGNQSASLGNAPALTIEGIDVGFAGHFKIGKWTPVVVTVHTTQPMTVQLIMEAPDPDGSRTRLPSKPIALATAGSHTLRSCFRTGRLNSEISIEIASEGQRLAARRLRPGEGDFALRPALRQSSVLWATLGQPAGFDSFNDQDGDAEANGTDRGGETAESRIVVAKLENPAALPTQVSGYNGLDTLIVTRAYDLPPAHNTALRQWVQSGGHLVVSAGSTVEEYLDGSLAEWISQPGEENQAVPVPIDREQPQMTVRDLSDIEHLAEQGARIVARRVPAAHLLRPEEGNVLARFLDEPLLVRVPYGFGVITFLGLDLHRPPLSRWDALPRVVRKIATVRPHRNRASQQNQGARLSQTGISDLATQLHAAQDYFPAVNRFSSWMVMGLMLLYLVVIGPVDYLVVHRLLKRPKLTWLTFPMLVALAVVSTVWAARSSNGDQLRVNQLDVIDIDEATTTVRSRTWATIYSPETRRYSVDVQPFGNSTWKTGDLLEIVEEPQVSWSGIPEEAFGGMYRSGGFEISRPPYQYASQASAIENLPVTIWSTKSLIANWHSQSDQLVESSLQNAGNGQLIGTFSHRLPVPVEDWLVAYGNRVYLPRQNAAGDSSPLPPHVPWNPTGPLVAPPRTLRGFLTGTRARTVVRKDGVGENILTEQTEYDLLSRNPTDILRTLTFHDVVSGKEYTGLENNTLRDFDLSGMLRLGRAVLFGRIEVPAARLKLNGEIAEPTTHTAYIRVLLPVKGPDNFTLPELIDKE